MLWIFLLAGAMASPLYFQQLWLKRGFRIFWWIALFAIVTGTINAARQGWL